MIFYVCVLLICVVVRHSRWRWCLWCGWRLWRSSFHSFQTPNPIRILCSIYPWRSEGAPKYRCCKAQKPTKNKTSNYELNIPYTTRWEFDTLFNTTTYPLCTLTKIFTLSNRRVEGRVKAHEITRQKTRYTNEIKYHVQHLWGIRWRPCVHKNKHDRGLRDYYVYDRIWNGNAVGLDQNGLVFL